MDKRPLDLYKLKKAVEVRGGFDRVCKDKKWAEIGRDLGYSGKIMSSLSTSLKNSYQRWLHPYEEWLKCAKPGVHQQLEAEHGGSFSSSVSQHQSSTTLPSGHPTAVSTGSPAVQGTTAAPNVSFNHAGAASQEPPPAPPAAPPTQPVSSSGFTAVNSGGFATVNHPSGFTAVNQAPPPVVKVEKNGPVPPVQSPAPAFLPINGPTITTIHSAASPISNGTANPLKRTMSHDSLNGGSGSEGANGDIEHATGRRSKRPKKGTYPQRRNALGCDMLI